jgi:acetyltransferase-like isoleucine patch superfamily enzyme
MGSGEAIDLVSRTADRFKRQVTSGSYSFIALMSGPIGYAARYRYWRRRLRSLGRDVTFGLGVQISGPGYISVGDNAWIDDYAVLTAGPPGDRPYLTLQENADFHGRLGEVTIGENCHIGQHVTLQGHGGLWIGANTGVASGSRIYTLSHHHRHIGEGAPTGTVFKFSSRAPIEEQALISSPVVVGASCAVGSNSVILPGSSLGEGSWLGALSMLAGKVPPDVVATGNPARVARAIHDS